MVAESYGTGVPQRKEKGGHLEGDEAALQIQRLTSRPASPGGPARPGGPIGPGGPRSPDAPDGPCLPGSPCGYQEKNPVIETEKEETERKDIASIHTIHELQSSLLQQEKEAT